MKVKEAMSKDVVKIDTSKSVHEAAKLMADKGVGCLLITSGRKTLGILTERDLVSKIVAESFDPSKVLVSDVMTTPMYTISSDQPVDRAAELMLKYKVRRLPVVDNDSLVGIITASDLAKALAEKLKSDDLILGAIARKADPLMSGPYK